MTILAGKWGVGQDDPQRSLPTPNILWFCDNKAITGQCNRPRTTYKTFSSCSWSF